jgi:hypothetical protein
MPFSRLLSISIAVFFTIEVQGQEEYTFRVYSLKEHVDFENEIGSIAEGTVYFNPYQNGHFHDMLMSDQFPEVTKNPILFERTSDPFYPKLKSWLFVDSDSLVKAIKYVWSLHNPTYDSSEQPDALKEQLGRQKEYEDKFDAVLAQVMTQIGPPDKQRGGEDESGLIVEFMWDRKLYRATLYLRFDKTIQTIPFGDGVSFADHRIELFTVFKEGVD